jgi:hypothetical protein
VLAGIGEAQPLVELAEVAERPRFDLRVGLLVLGRAGLTIITKNFPILIGHLIGHLG